MSTKSLKDILQPFIDLKNLKPGLYDMGGDMQGLIYVKTPTTAMIMSYKDAESLLNETDEEFLKAIKRK